MKTLFTTSLLCGLFLTTSCGMFSGESENKKSVAPGALAGKDAAGTVDINKLLGSVKDKPTAEAAKGPLESALASLKGRMGNGKTTGAADASGGMGKMAPDALAKFGINGNTMGMVTGLLGNPTVAGVIGPALEQLKGLLPK
ncbi:MAG: hypothetical protein ABIP94_07715 [Planctomycetota bacterium]